MVDHGEPVLLDGVSVVVPVFGGASDLVELCARLGHQLADRPHEVILVDDGGPRSDWETVRSCACSEPTVRALRLSRNAGQHSALLAGIRASRFATVVTLDDDLQNPPEEIPRLLDAMERDVDVVYGISRNISQAWWRRAGSLAIHLLLDRLLAASGAPRATSFRAFRTRLREAFASEVGPQVSLDALLTWSTDRFVHVEVRHDARRGGRSNYSFWKLLRFATDTVTGYSTRPLRMISTLGFLASGFGVGILGYVLARYLIQGASVAGFPFLASIIAIFSGAQMLSLGVIGEYLARMHVRLLRQPTYVIAESVGFDAR